MTCPQFYWLKSFLSAIVTAWITLSRGVLGWGGGFMNPVDFRIVMILLKFLCFLKFKQRFRFKASRFTTPGLED